MSTEIEILQEEIRMLRKDVKHVISQLNLLIGVKEVELILKSAERDDLQHD